MIYSLSEGMRAGEYVERISRYICLMKFMSAFKRPNQIGVILPPGADSSIVRYRLFANELEAFQGKRLACG